MEVMARLAVLLLGLAPAAAGAQPAPGAREVDPLTCWWRTSAAAVRVGEPFALLLTCSVLETDAARGVVDRSRLVPAAVQLPPFEVVGGAEGPDRVAGGRRFIQYEYSLRLISQEAFGADLAVPEMPVSFRIESRVEGTAAVQGRDQTYVLPAIPVRVISLVPDNARQIREAVAPTFGEIAAREFRARLLRLVATVLFGIAALTLAVGAVRWARERRAGRGAAQRLLLAHRTVIAGLRREFDALQYETRRAGWTVAAVARALAAGRILAGYVEGRPVLQRAADGPVLPGELRLRGGWLSRRSVAVSTAFAPRDAKAAGTADGAIAPALATLTRARYGRDAGLDGAKLDAALDSLIQAAGHAASRHTRFAGAVRAVRTSVAGRGSRAWAR
jgi:hypothetical protein